MNEWFKPEQVREAFREPIKYPDFRMDDLEGGIVSIHVRPDHPSAPGRGLMQCVKESDGRLTPKFWERLLLLEEYLRPWYRSETEALFCLEDSIMAARRKVGLGKSKASEL